MGLRGAEPTQNADANHAHDSAGMPVATRNNGRIRSGIYGAESESRAGESRVGNGALILIRSLADSMWHVPSDCAVAERKGKYAEET